MMKISSPVQSSPTQQRQGLNFTSEGVEKNFVDGYVDLLNHLTGQDVLKVTRVEKTAVPTNATAPFGRNPQTLDIKLQNRFSGPLNDVLAHGIKLFSHYGKNNSSTTLLTTVTSVKKEDPLNLMTKVHSPFASTPTKDPLEVIRNMGKLHFPSEPNPQELQVIPLTLPNLINGRSNHFGILEKIDTANKALTLFWKQLAHPTKDVFDQIGR
jgi:hypothetical protein